MQSFKAVGPKEKPGEAMKVWEYNSYMMCVKQVNQWYVLHKPLFDTGCDNMLWAMLSISSYDNNALPVLQSIIFTMNSIHKVIDLVYVQQHISLFRNEPECLYLAWEFLFGSWDHQIQKSYF